MTCNVKWADKFSREFRVPLVIKQGGINLPDYFGCYIDDIAAILRNANIGCHMYGPFLAMNLLADNNVNSSTRQALDRMVQLCAKYCNGYDGSFDANKSKIIVFSKLNLDKSSLHPILLNGKSIEYVESITYLGTTIVNNKGFAFSSIALQIPYSEPSSSQVRN